MAGIKPRGKVEIKWSPKFAYAIGLLATDGNISRDGRRIDFSSKDKEQIKNFLRGLNIKVKIGEKRKINSRCLRVQFGDILFCKFLTEIGLTSKKSKTIGTVKVPDIYFFDFLRGLFDGDGTFYSYWDSRWKSSFMFYVVFISASKKHIDWIREELHRRIGVTGHITKSPKNSCYQLKYAKREGLVIIKKMYKKNKNNISLKRKRLKIEKALSIMGTLL